MSSSSGSVKSQRPSQSRKQSGRKQLHEFESVKKAVVSQLKRVPMEPAFNEENSMIFDEEDDIFDEYGFKLLPHVAKAYNAHRVARASFLVMNTERYKSVLRPLKEFDAQFGRQLKYRFKDDETTTLFMLGVPHTHRRKVWLMGSGVNVLVRSHARHYQKLCRKLDKAISNGTGLGKEENDAIDKDMGGRTTGTCDMPDRQAFVSKVKRVVQLHSLDKKEDGYAQGLNMIAAALLVQNMTEEEAFWMMHYITQVLFPSSYNRKVSGQHADINTFDYYFSAKFKSLARMLSQAGSDIKASFAVAAFGSLLCNMMPYESVFTVWDYVFTGGRAYQFHICLLKIVQYIHKRIESHIKKRARRGLPGLDSSEFLELFRDKLNSIVDMPRVLATKLEGRQIDPAAFEWRRNVTNETYYEQLIKPHTSKLTSHSKGSASSEDGDISESVADREAVARVQSINFEDNDNNNRATSSSSKGMPRAASFGAGSGSPPPSDLPPTPRGLTRNNSLRRRMRASTMIARANSTSELKPLSSLSLSARRHIDKAVCSGYGSSSVHSDEQRSITTGSGDESDSP